MMRPSLVIFDCDGVLVDTEGLSNTRLSQWLTEAGYPVDYETCRRRFEGRSMMSVKSEIEEAGIDLGEDFVERWNLGLPDLFAAGVTEVPHVRSFIEELRTREIPYCVASSARVSKMHITLGATGLLPYFQHAMFSSTMVARGKPFPDLFLHAATTMGVPPAGCVVIEDSVAGTRAGRAADMTVYSYAGDPFAHRETLASAGGIVFDNMRDLSGIIGLA
ncbi:MAG: HAD family phosphatase [Hyphomicrobiales bacterium]|nr:HAD family phosphatase [Hyphomicrobiales bacterium]